MTTSRSSPLSIDRDTERREVRRRGGHNQEPLPVRHDVHLRDRTGEGEQHSRRRKRRGSPGVTALTITSRTKQKNSSFPSARQCGLTPEPAVVHRAATGTVELIQASGDRIPLRDNTVDTVVTTWTLCSLAKVPSALQEMRRVLKPTPSVARPVDTALETNSRRMSFESAAESVAGQCGLRGRPLGEHYGEGPKPLADMCEGRAHVIL
jgi:hypothetical protein